MKALTQRLLATVFLSVLLASLLSLVPMLLSHTNKDSDLAVFEPEVERSLNRDRLVDFLLSQSVQMDLKRVDWNGGALFLEMAQTPGMSEEAMYRELFRMVKNCLVETDNIQTVRLYVHGSHARQFLLEANRQQLARDPQMKNAKHLPAKRYLEQMFEITSLSSS